MIGCLSRRDVIETHTLGRFLYYSYHQARVVRAE